MPAQILDFLGQVVLDRTLDASEQELGRLRAVEIAIEIGGIVQDLDIAMRRWRRPPGDERHQCAGVVLQRSPVVVDPVEHDRGDRKHHALRRELARRQHVVDQAAMQSAVAVLIGVDVDEAEGCGRRLQDRVQAALAHAPIRRQHAGDQIRQVLGPRADELRQWIMMAIALADENAVRAKARANEAGVLDQ